MGLAVEIKDVGLVLGAWRVPLDFNSSDYNYIYNYHLQLDIVSEKI